MKPHAGTVACLLLFAGTACLPGCSSQQPSKGSSDPSTQKTITMKQEPFGIIGDRKVSLFTFENANGMTVKITNYGGIVTSLSVPGKDGKIDDVVQGFDSLKTYLAGHPYFGCIVGRYANRISKGEFKLDGRSYELAKNAGGNHLHGGIAGFDKKVWEAVPFENANESGLVLSYLSMDGEEGYPGNLRVTVTYSLNNDNELKIKYLAGTDAPTVLNLTHHSYFNLNGEGNGDIMDHILYINADRFTAINDELIPTGELKEVAGGPMDFRTAKPIGKDFALVPGGYDHNFAVNTTGGLTLAATLSSPPAGRVMEVFTTQPGIQFYAGNFLDGSLTGKGGKPYRQHYALCLETQHFPDSPNQPAFPNVVLRPGEKFESETIYKFSVK
jgi:aldose 1-epimerase